MMNSITKRQSNQKVELLEKLKETPIIEVACRKVGIARATFYRWKLNDEKFAKEADLALEAGSALVNDMAESQLLSAIKDQNMSAIIFWLRNRHPAYTNKVEVTGQLKHEYTLSEEEEALIAKALSMVTQNKEEL